MRRQKSTNLLISSVLLLAGVTASEAYAHGIGSSPFSRILRIDNEQFSDNTFETMGSGLIEGELISVSDEPLNIAVRLYVTPTQVNMPEGRIGEIPWYYSQLSTIYPPFRDQFTMYFKIETGMTRQVILEPGETMTYEIRFYPLDAGAYHVHTYVITEDGAKIARGQTIIVGGENQVTQGEILQLYLPASLFVTATVILSALLLKRIHPRRWNEKAIGFIFVLKSSYETMLVSGIAFSLLLSQYLPGDAVVPMTGLSVWLGAITIGGYFSIGATMHRRTIAFGTLVATSIFYFVLLYSGCSYTYSQCYPFNFDGFFVFLVAIGNAIAAAALFAMIAREKKNLRQNI